jgi:hypothetical protein
MTTFQKPHDPSVVNYPRWSRRCQSSLEQKYFVTQPYVCKYKTGMEMNNSYRGAHLQ